MSSNLKEKVVDNTQFHKHLPQSELVLRFELLTTYRATVKVIHDNMNNNTNNNNSLLCACKITGMTGLLAQSMKQE